jgi:hypothetical protein
MLFGELKNFALMRTLLHIINCVSYLTVIELVCSGSEENSGTIHTQFNQ